MLEFYFFSMVILKHFEIAVFRWLQALDDKKYRTINQSINQSLILANNIITKNNDTIKGPG